MTGEKILKIITKYVKYVLFLMHFCAIEEDKIIIATKTISASEAEEQLSKALQSSARESAVEAAGYTASE